MEAKDKLVGTFAGVYIVTPGAENHTELIIATAEAAKEAGIKHVVVVSVLTAELTDTVFGKQLKTVEEKISKLGVPFTFLRLPLFVDNCWGFIRTQLWANHPFFTRGPHKTIHSCCRGRFR